MIISSNDNYSRVIMAPIVELNSLINSDVYNLSIQSTCSSPHFLSINIIQCLSTVKFHLNAASPLYLSTPHPLPLSLQTHTIPSLGPPGPRHCQYSLYYRHIAFYLIFNINLSNDLIRGANIPFRIVTISMLSRFIDPEENCPMCADC